MKKIPASTKKISLFKPLIYFIYLLLVWSLYRIYFRLPDWAEELIIKPVIWLSPIFYFIIKDKSKLSDLGITLKNIFRTIYFTLALGTGFALLGFIANLAKYQKINFAAEIGRYFIGFSILLSFATAITEEIVFRGYMLGKFSAKYSEAFSIFLVSLFWTLIHAPVSYFVWGMDGMQMVVYLLLTFFYGVGASILFFKTKNIISPILLHVLWEWPIILFR